MGFKNPTCYIIDCVHLVFITFIAIGIAGSILQFACTHDGTYIDSGQLAMETASV